MIRTAFAHDHVFKVVKNSGDSKVYTPGKLPAHVWTRYLSFSGHILVIARRQYIHADETSVFSESSARNVSFNFVESLGGVRNAIRNSAPVNLELRKALAECDCLIARLPSEIGMAAIAIARNEGIPYAIEVVGCVWDALWNYGGWISKLYAPLAYFRMRRHVAKCAHVIYVTSKFLQNRYPAYGVTAAASNVILKSNSGKIRSSFKGGPPFNLGIIASLNSRSKGIQTAIHAISLMSQEEKLRDQLTLTIVGDGDPRQFRQQIEKLGVASYVRFAGVLPKGGPLEEWVAKLDLYLQPSLQEGLPRALIEVMASGCPCLGSTAGGIPELLPKRALHKPGSAFQLAKLARRVLFNVEERMELSRLAVSKSGEYVSENVDRVRSDFWVKFHDMIKSRRATDNGKG